VDVAGVEAGYATKRPDPNIRTLRHQRFIALNATSARRQSFHRKTNLPALFFSAEQFNS
jgi:hypothetical protein